MKTISFDFNPDLLRDFVELSWRLHRRDPHWIPPSRAKIGRQLSPENPFFEYGDIKHFMAFEKNTALGRVSAIVNTRAAEGGEQLGFLGFFESVPEFSVTERLLSEAVDYFRQRGIKRIRGPINFSMWHKYRFMVTGFEHPPFFLEPYNPPYYPSFFEGFGFKKVMRYFSSLVVDHDPSILSSKEKCQRFFQSGHTIRQIDLSQMKSELGLLYELSVKIFADAWAYTEISPSEFLDLYEGLERVVDSSLIMFAYDPRGEPIGFLFGVPDISGPMRRMGGKTHLSAKLSFLLAKRKVDTVVFKTMGVIPEARKVGVGSVLMGLLHKSAKQKGYPKVIHALMREDNYTIRKMSDIGGKVFKEYALYELTL